MHESSRKGRRLGHNSSLTEVPSSHPCWALWIVRLFIIMSLIFWIPSSAPNHRFCLQWIFYGKMAVSDSFEVSIWRSWNAVFTCHIPRLNCHTLHTPTFAKEGKEKPSCYWLSWSWLLPPQWVARPDFPALLRKSLDEGEKGGKCAWIFFFLASVSLSWHCCLHALASLSTNDAYDTHCLIIWRLRQPPQFASLWGQSWKVFVNVIFPMIL